MGYTAELRGCVEVERWEGLPKVSAASDFCNASDVCRPPLELLLSSMQIVSVPLQLRYPWRLWLDNGGDHSRQEGTA